MESIEKFILGPEDSGEEVEILTLIHDICRSVDINVNLVHFSNIQILRSVLGL